MSWEQIRRRMLEPVGRVGPHDTSPFGDTNRPKNGTNPHKGVDSNYIRGQYAPLNLSHQGIRSPIDGVVVSAGSGTVGRVAIRDKNGFVHEFLHTHTRHVNVGDPVAAGQLIATMGNTGVLKPNVESGANHLHYQLRDPAGKIIDPTAFWDEREPGESGWGSSRYDGISKISPEFIRPLA